MDTKWTTGPWAYVEPEMLSHDAPGFTHKLSSGGIMGGTLDDPQWVIADADYIESEADIHLIAAAPDLYEALEALCEATAGSEQDLWPAAFNALKKARGET